MKPVVIRSFIEDWAARVACSENEPAVVVRSDVQPQTWTYQQLDHQVRYCLMELRKQGLKPGDAVVAMLPNAFGTVVAFLASLMGGFSYAPLQCLASSREIDRWLRINRPKLILTSSLLNSEQREFIQKTGIAGYSVPDPGYSQELVARALVGLDRKQFPVGDRTGKIMVSTSGTTGEPKAIVIDGDRLWTSGREFMEFHGLLNSGLRFWNYLPMSYLGGLFNLTLIPFSIGGSFLIDETFSGKTFLEFWPTIQRFDINAVWLVPTLVRGLLSLSSRVSPEQRQKQGAMIRASFLGTAPIDLKTKETFERAYGIFLRENFALSETTFFTSESEADRSLRTEGSVGRTLPYVELCLQPVDDEKDAPMEFLIKSPFLFDGYLLEDGTLQKPLNKDGFFATGDLARPGEGGVWEISGRRREIIKKGGYLVALREVEAIVHALPGVKEAAAVPVPHPFYGEAYHLFVVFEDAAQSDEKISSLAAEVHQSLVKFKWPESIKAVATLPKTASGKIQKHLLSASLL